MGEANDSAKAGPVWQSDQGPCVYCGQVIDRASGRCLHCRTSFSMAVRKASRDVEGPWFYLDPRNPSGRGVSFETLVKMIEKGRIRADSVVRGPTTHQDWMYAAEAPRLAKFIGMCPHCFAEAKPEDTYCSSCQLNMNTRPAEARPGIPPDLIKEPFHSEAYAMEEKLAGGMETAPAARFGGAAAAPTPPPGPAARPELTPSPAAVAAVAALADSATSLGDRPSRVIAVARKPKPKIWIILMLTWMTLVPLLVLAYFVPIPFLHDRLRAMFGTGTQTVAPDPVPPEPAPDANWLTAQLAAADKAEQAGDYDGAVRIYEAVVAKTGDTSWEKRIEELRRKPEEQRQARLAKLKERLDLAESMAAEKRFDDALAVLRSIGDDDRQWLVDSFGVGVDKMEVSIRAAQQREVAQKQKQEQLVAQLNQAAKFVEAQQLPEALAAYQKVQGAFEAAMIAKHIDLAKTIQDLQAKIQAAPPPIPPTPEPDPGEAAKAIADLLAKAAAFEKEENFAEALTVLESIKTTYDVKFWPDKLEERIQQVKAKKEALEFFGMK